MIKTTIILRTSLIFVLSSPIFSSLAQDIALKRQKVSLELPYIEAEIKVDAVLDEKIWQQALKVELNYETSPGENTKPKVKTEAYLFENGDTLYVGFKAFDDKPQEIRDYLSDRDNIWNSDIVGLKFDTFGESRKAFQFFVNAIGVQADSTQEDFRGDDQSWNAIWESHGKVTDFGYVVEMAIPFKALRFPDTGELQSWGVEILRFRPREKAERIANTPVDRDIPCNICQFDKLVGFSRIKPSNNLQLVPTLVIGQTDTRDDPATNQDWQNGELDESVGMDFRWGITQDIILNATLNPDFSQVEADSAQLDINNTYSIFLEEKRPFFLEGADYFRTPNRLLHTRDIVDPDYGVKVTGQTNGHSFGLFTANDNRTSFLIPGNQGSSLVDLRNSESQNQVIRYSQDLGNKNNVGIIVTDKTGEDYSNRVVAFDSRYWFDQNHSINLQYMQSDSQYADVVLDEYIIDSDIDPILNPAQYEAERLKHKNISDNAYTISFNHDSRNWWGYLNHNKFGKDFRADLGFIGQVNFQKTVIGAGHRWFPKDTNGWWTQIDFGGDWDITHDGDGKELERESEISFNLNGLNQLELGAGAGVRNRFYDGENDQVEFENGRYYDENYIYTYAFFQPIEGLNLGVNINKADSIDFSNSQLGDSLRISPRITWQHGQHWKTRFEYEDVDFDVPGGDLFDAAIANVRVTYQVNVRSLFRLTLQNLEIIRDPSLYIDAVDEKYESKSIQFLYSYKINPRTLFFAGYSDEGYQDDNQNTFEKTGRSVFTKFSYAWQL
jgi:hypothetical protein